MKYRTPYGAPAFIYYPQKIRELYQKQVPIKRLFIQEGEKKAEKATKHGIPLHESILCWDVGALHHRTAPDGRVREAGGKEWGIGVSPKE